MPFGVCGGTRDKGRCSVSPYWELGTRAVLGVTGAHTATCGRRLGRLSD